jgi:phage shock protein PspC (stress-responsive transcriptional regulator)
VAGGLGDYLGVDATALRLGFVLISVFLAMMGGVVIYLIAWMVLPEENGPGAAPGPGPANGAFSGQPWHDWDRSARSWAVVLASLALAFIWYFGVWPSWHWGALPMWLLLTGVAIWAISRHRSGAWARPSPSWPPRPGTASAYRVSAAGTAGPAGGPTGSPVPGSPLPGPTGSPAGAPDGEPAGTASSGPVPPVTVSPETADWAEAQSEAREWAESQLAAAGVPPQSAAPSPVPEDLRTGPRAHQRSRLRRATKVLVALLAAFFLLMVVMVVAMALKGGASLSGGVGGRAFAPLTNAGVSPHYRLSIGDLDLDLSAVKFPDRGRTVDLTVGVGDLTVEVPTGTVVNVDAHSGIGDVTVFGQSGSGSNVHLGSPSGLSADKRAPHLTINANVGIGEVDVSWTAPLGTPPMPTHPRPATSWSSTSSTGA